MKISDTLPQAIRNLTRRKVRTFLTSFAVFIGIFLLTLILSIGIGVRKWMIDQITGQVEYTRVTVTEKGAMSGMGDMFSTGSSGLSSQEKEEEGGYRPPQDPGQGCAKVIVRSCGAKQQLEHELREYCKLDTLAMVRLARFLASSKDQP